LIIDLNKIYTKIENNLDEAKIITKELTKELDDLGNIIQTLEDEDLESDES